MAKTKISTLAKDLNVALPTVIDFLHKKNIDIDGSPNTRVEDDVVELLMNEFKHDKNLKPQAVRPTPKPAPQPVRTEAAPKAEPVETKAETAGPRILGKIELDKKGNPVVKKVEEPAPAPKPQPAPAPKAPEVKKAEEKPAVKPAPAETPAKPAAPQPPVVKQEPKPAKQVPAHVAEPQKAEKPAAPAVKPAPVSVEPAATEKNEPEVFELERKVAGPSVNVIGKIDLDAINQSTRPKKKTKEERRNARAGQSGEGVPGDRKKRKRIGGKEKIDIEKTGQQAAQNERNQRQASQGGNAGSGERGGKNASKDKKRNDRRPAAPQHVTVSDEDVSKQVKETLARLTNKDKGLKRGAKWRKEKREMVANREREAAQAEAAESRVLKLTEFVTANDLAIMIDRKSVV